MTPLKAGLHPLSRLKALLPGLLLVIGLSGCAAGPGQPPAESQTVPSPLIVNSLAEQPVADAEWRPHRVSWCDEGEKPSTEVESLLGLCSEYFREGSGTDGMLELELALEEGQRHPLLLMTLGQLYLIAGQGEPELLPREGPVADVGDWSRNQPRLLGRAESLLGEAALGRPSDAAIDYLLADVARTRGDHEMAHQLVLAAAEKCTSGRGFSTLMLYQQLFRYPGKYLGGPGPDYPPAALKARITGDVVLDLLISPLGQVRQAVVVRSPSPALSRAAAASLEAGSWESARIGKYPIWSWLRVSTSFSLAP